MVVRVLHFVLAFGHTGEDLLRDVACVSMNPESLDCVLSEGLDLREGVFLDRDLILAGSKWNFHFPAFITRQG